jgi:hypothetical protein
MHTNWDMNNERPPQHQKQKCNENDIYSNDEDDERNLKYEYLWHAIAL